jgi:adenylate cyclase
VSDSPDGTPSPDAAPVPDPADLAQLVERVETSLLAGERKYTRIEMAEKSGLALDEVRALWRALGFATVDDDERRVFTDADLEALKRVKRLASVGNIDDEVMRAMTRIIGQSFARLASWQGQLVIEIVAKSPELLEGGGDSVLELVDELIPLTGELHDYVWRRQLAAYFTRISAGETGSSSTKAVGFADMAAFTAFTRRSSEAELRGVLELFESVATDVVGANHGQIVKTIGDEVLFVADTAVDGAEIALALVEASETNDELPHLRVGLAAGEVVSRLGDVFGQTVNIASRLTSIARTGSILVDQGMSAALEGDDRYALKPLRPTSVRGYEHLRSWRLRRAQAG